MWYTHIHTCMCAYINIHVSVCMHMSPVFSYFLFQRSHVYSYNFLSVKSSNIVCYGLAFIKKLNILCPVQVVWILNCQVGFTH